MPAAPKAGKNIRVVRPSDYYFRADQNTDSQDPQKFRQYEALVVRPIQRYARYKSVRYEHIRAALLFAFEFNVRPSISN